MIRTDLLGKIKEKTPLIHSITNSVSICDCANILLAIGAKPIMADDPAEVAEVTQISDGLVINMGMPNDRKLEAMLSAGKRANELHLPVVLDPVGAGVSAYRREILKSLLENIHFTVIRGNASEIRELIQLCNLENAIDETHQISELAERLSSVIVMTGEKDIVADSKNVYFVENGSSKMRLVTGMGCQLTSLLAAFLAVCPEDPLQAALTAVASMGICGEQAESSLKPGEGLGTYRVRVMDAVSLLDRNALLQNAHAHKEISR